MSRATPNETFIEAQAAIKREDWDSFFECLDNKDLIKIAVNGVNLLLWSDKAAAKKLCAQHGASDAAMLNWCTLLDKMQDSAQTLLRTESSINDMLNYSLQHKKIVEEAGKAQEAVLKAISDLPRFTAVLEKLLRANQNGGSVSSHLFVDEVLVNILIIKNRAYATREIAGEHYEDIGFVKRNNKWYIQLFVKRRKCDPDS